MPGQACVSSFTALALTAAAARRSVAFKPAAGVTTMTGSSVICSFSGMSASSMRSWNAVASCLHCSLCP
eukprot:CAMPEP_0184252536 /NCGR_PEP_ID=MMETSP0977-20130417/6077_1 /TAXON_ID=483370 /ORGANISM="non described non described, Strain CCMP2097" /LENGTH=68 /DNA_ID=CAMNT_0026558019 /DNA_START=126 /DNA_END=328 /DNA_ORIENTATION=-